MTIPLLTTKLHVPPPRADLLSRPRLVHRLDEGLRMDRRLTLVSAPAGYGKTTLLSAWASERVGPSGGERSVAWLSLDAEDSDPVRFWTYLVAALQQVEPEIGQGLTDALRSPQGPPFEAFLTPLINQIAGLPHGLLLVLDDYHLITHAAIHEGLVFLLDHLPNTIHLIIASRADPPLPLARLRGRRELTELRQADLQFTLDEAAAFLKRVVGVDLSSEEVAMLDERTEGWITGLQLAAHSMRGRDDVSGFLSAFAGSHRYVLDYLTEEVLQRQPEGIRAFLLHTSVLDRLSGPLCDAVLGISRAVDERESSNRPLAYLPSPFVPESIAHSFDGSSAALRTSSQALLEHLEANNLFVVPLDDQRTWYRYHRLFADLLRARLEDLYPDRVPELHQRASAWYEREGMLDSAMKHALAADDAAEAARIVEIHGRSLLLRGELTTLLGWIESLPEEKIQASAPISVTHAWALLLTGQLGGVEPRLQQVERIVASDSPLLGDVAAIRAYVTSQHGDVARTIDLGQKALERLPLSKLAERAVVHFVLGGADLLKGDVPAAEEAMSRAATVGREGGNLHLALPALNSLAGIQLSRGDLRRAKATAQEAVALVTGADGQPLPIAAGAVSALAELAYEWNKLDEALAQARQGVELARLWGNADTLGFAHLTLAEVLVALGRLDQTRDTLRDAERLRQDKSFFPSFSPALEAAWARLWLHEGDVAAARSWAKEAPSEATGLVAMKETFTLAWINWALGRRQEAREVVSALLGLARRQKLGAWLVRGLALEALIYNAEGRSGRALNALAEALMLAEPGTYVRSFVDMGPPMVPLLKAAAAQGIRPEYVKRLLSAFDVAPEEPALPTVQPLIEPLSARELEVLGLVAKGLSNREVGRRLHIAESTVKSHLNTVYGKLAVDNRTQAAAKARALNLL